MKSLLNTRVIAAAVMAAALPTAAHAGLITHDRDGFSGHSVAQIEAFSQLQQPLNTRSVAVSQATPERVAFNDQQGHSDAAAKAFQQIARNTNVQTHFASQGEQNSLGHSPSW